MPPSPVLITLRGWNEKQAMSPCGLPIRSQRAVPQDLAADCAGRILDDRQAVALGDRHHRGEVARHARPGARTRIAVVARRDRRLDQRRVDVAGGRIDVDEDRRRRRSSGSTLAVAMYEWLTVMTSSPGADADGQQRQVQAGGAVRHGAGVRRADEGGELLLERGHLRALRDPAGEDDRAVRRRPPPAPITGRGERDLRIVPVRHAPPRRRRARCHHSTSSREPVLEIDLGLEAEALARRAGVGQARGHGVDRCAPGRTRAAGPTPITLHSAWARSFRLVSVPLAMLKTSSDDVGTRRPGCWRGRCR